MKPALFALPLLLAVAGCNTNTAKISSGSPELSLVGEGLSVERTALPAKFTEPEQRSFHSLWSGRDDGLFGDLRARKVGDIVTVTIDINDQAQFDNQTGRSRQADSKGGFTAGGAFSGFGLHPGTGSFSGNIEGSASSVAQGAGSIDRSEKLHLSIAAVVTEVLPQGNLLISGSQEVRVNHEVRVLNIAGIVRLLDIGSNNIVSYEKIAEARVSYGGRGNLTETQ